MADRDEHDLILAPTDAELARLRATSERLLGGSAVGVALVNLWVTEHRVAAERRATDRLKQATDALADITEKSSASLTKATWVLGGATVVLALATIALVSATFAYGS